MTWLTIWLLLLTGWLNLLTGWLILLNELLSVPNNWAWANDERATVVRTTLAIILETDKDLPQTMTETFHHGVLAFILRCTWFTGQGSTQLPYIMLLFFLVGSEYWFLFCTECLFMCDFNWCLKQKDL